MKFSAVVIHTFMLAVITCLPSSLYADGRVRFLRRSDPSFDVYTNSPTSSQQQWMRDKFYRMSVFAGYFDSRTSWYPNGLVYIDSYAIYKDSELARSHPEWILKDEAGNRLYIPWGCSNGTCPQYAGDISNPAFRKWWITEAKRLMALGYRGLWIDDVNMEFRVGDGYSRQVAPYDPNTRMTMSWENWRRYMCEFMEQIRLEVPNAEILHNSIWFAGPTGRDSDVYIQRQIAAADIINIEHGVNDPGLTGGTGIWSLSTLHAYIDRVHQRGKAVVIDDFGNARTELEYALANYQLINNGTDAVGNMSMTPSNWFSGYDVILGAPLGARKAWNGLWRRDFQGGMVLVNEPDAPSRTVSLPGTYRKIDGTTVTSITLGAKQGLVLTLVSPAPPAPPSGTSTSVTSYLSDLNYQVVSNGYGPVEKDRSNGEAAAGDGGPLRLNGITYAKGLGVHAASEIRYALNGRCSIFQARVGVDDEIATSRPATVVFQVWADGTKLFDSAVMNPASPTKTAQVSLSGKNLLRLVVTDAGDGPSFDHADWADAKLACLK